MLIFGAIDFAAALARQGSLLERLGDGVRRAPCSRHLHGFPTADEVIVDWPDRYLATQAADAIDAGTAICVLTHDPKFDVPVLGAAALRWHRSATSGAMGSRQTHIDRLDRLRGGRTDRGGAGSLRQAGSASTWAPAPRGNLVLIAAEIIARRWGGGGGLFAEAGLTDYDPS